MVSPIASPVPDCPSVASQSNVVLGKLDDKTILVLLKEQMLGELLDAVTFGLVETNIVEVALNGCAQVEVLTETKVNV